MTMALITMMMTLMMTMSSDDHDDDHDYDGHNDLKLLQARLGLDVQLLLNLVGH